jgi:hypothetical protein
VDPTTTTSAAAVPRAVALRVPAQPWAALTAWALSFAAVFYLALRGGGYDVVVRDQVGILVWWIVVLVAVAGLLPSLTRLGWAALALLAAWAAARRLPEDEAERVRRAIVPADPVLPATWWSDLNDRVSAAIAMATATPAPALAALG